MFLVGIQIRITKINANIIDICKQKLCKDIFYSYPLILILIQTKDVSFHKMILTLRKTSSKICTSFAFLCIMSRINAYIIKKLNPHFSFFSDIVTSSNKGQDIDTF